jgi:hypothetical protein
VSSCREFVSELASQQVGKSASQQVSGSAGHTTQQVSHLVTQLSWRKELLKGKSNSVNGGRTRHYRDLLVWQKAMELTKNVYRLTENLPQKEAFVLHSQIRRASVSVPSNIAEGHGRMDIFANFLRCLAGLYLRCRHNWS